MIVKRRSNSLHEWLTELGKMTFSQWMQYVGKILAILYAVLLAVFLFVSDKFSTALGINAQQIAAGFVLLVAGFLFYFDQRLNQLLSPKGLLPKQSTMRDAFEEVLSRYPRSLMLRVYGSTTQLMVQWVEACYRKDESLHIRNCKILTHTFSSNDFPGQAEHYNTIRNDSIAKWKNFLQSDVIGSLTFATTNVLPQSFAVILDDKAAIIGTYVLRKNGPTGLLDLKPIVIYGQDDSQKAIIATYTQWFDAWFAESTPMP